MDSKKEAKTLDKKTANEKWLKELGKVAFDAAEEMLETLPDNKEYVEGRTVLSGKEVKEMFKTDLEFAKKNVRRVVKLKFHQTLRKKKG